MNLQQILETPGCELLNDWLMLNFGETLSDRLPPTDNSEEFDEIVEPATERPKIVCLCGSTRFHEAFQEANYRLTMLGRIVLTVGFYPHSSQQVHGQDIGCNDEQKQRLDELHKRKIDLADAVYVLNVDGYIGSSTRSEIDYATALGKPVDYLEPSKA